VLEHRAACLGELRVVSANSVDYSIDEHEPVLAGDAFGALAFIVILKRFILQEIPFLEYFLYMRGKLLHRTILSVWVARI
jgi:hypothetical protein